MIITNAVFIDSSSEFPVRIDRIIVKAQFPVG